MFGLGFLVGPFAATAEVTGLGVDPNWAQIGGTFAVVLTAVTGTWAFLRRSKTDERVAGSGDVVAEATKLTAEAKLIEVASKTATELILALEKRLTLEREEDVIERARDAAERTALVLDLNTKITLVQTLSVALKECETDTGQLKRLIDKLEKVAIKAGERADEAEAIAQQALGEVRGADGV